MNPLEQTPEAILNEALKCLKNVNRDIIRKSLSAKFELEIAIQYVKHAQSLIKKAGAK